MFKTIENMFKNLSSVQVIILVILLMLLVDHCIIHAIKKDTENIRLEIEKQTQEYALKRFDKMLELNTQLNTQLLEEIRSVIDSNLCRKHQLSSPESKDL